MLTPCGRAPQDLGLQLVQLQPVGFHPPRHVVDADRHPLSKFVSLGRLTEPAYLSVICVSVWHEMMPLDQLQKVSSVQEKQDWSKD